MRIRLLGEVGAVTDRGRPVDVGPAKCQALLAALALSAGSPVPVWRLAELVWGDHPPRTAARTLQSYVAHLRKALGPGAISRASGGYRLDVPADAVDALRFQRLLDSGQTGAALAEWAGLPLAGLAAPGLTALADGLTERWLGAVETELDQRARTDPAAAIGPLTELTAGHPFREGLWAALMTALYRAGRQADALAAYRTARGQLIEQVGVEPGPRLRELEQLILGQDPALAPDAGAGLDLAPGRGPELDPDPGNLPRRLGRLFGREADLVAIAAALDAAPVVTLTGPGGIGKTRLALAAAQRAGVGGRWFVDLAETTDPGAVARVVATVLDITEGPGRPLIQSVVAALRSRRVLLVLDNCEHVIEGAAALAQAVAEGCPRARVLATSRQGLGLVHGLERLITVRPLDPEGAAAELFTARAAAVSAAFDAVASRAAVVEICRAVDGVPLAIELAAARISSLTPEDMTRRLDDQLRLLSAPGRAGTERHRTLRATIQWSYDLLSKAEQRLFQRLSVFVGPFSLAAAETVAAGLGLDGAGVSELLGQLAERSMVAVEPGPGPRRFRLLETIRQFAAGQLSACGEAQDVAAGHARWCVDQGRDIQRLLAAQAEAEGVARLDELWPNYRAAFDWACARRDPELAYALVRPVVVEVIRRTRLELGDWTERLLAITPPGDVDHLVFGLSWAAQRYKLTQEPDRYERLADRYGEPDHPLTRHARAAVHQDFAALAGSAPPAVALLRGQGDDDLADQFDLDAAAALVFTGEVDAGVAALITLASRYRRHGPPTLLHLTLMMLGISVAAQGDSGRAQQLFEEAAAVAVPEHTQSPGRPIEARAAFRRGDRARAFRILSGYIDELLTTGAMQPICVTSGEFITMMTALGRLPEAAAMLSHLDRTAPYWAPQVAGARREIEAKVAPGPADHPLLTDQEALAYMRRVLHQLSGGAGA